MPQLNSNRIQQQMTVITETEQWHLSITSAEYDSMSSPGFDKVEIRLGDRYDKTAGRAGSWVGTFGQFQEFLKLLDKGLWAKKPVVEEAVEEPLKFAKEVTLEDRIKAAEETITNVEQTFISKGRI